MKLSRNIFRIFVFILLCFCLALTAFATEKAQGEKGSYYLAEGSNVDTIHAMAKGTLPCIGDAKIVVFYVDFIDGETNWTKTKEEIEYLFFSDYAKNDSSLAFSDKDSVRSFYYRSSYGKVDITGDVFEYQAKESATYYYKNDISLCKEIINHYKNLINWNDYDGNNDGYVDGIYIVTRKTPLGEQFWHSTRVDVCDFELGDKQLAHYCFMGMGEDTDYFETLLHETCHMFGPEDVYAGSYRNPSGIETLSIMETGQADLPSPMKFVLGWMDNVVFVDSENIGSFSLRSYSDYGDLIVVYPNGDTKNRNWFFIEYVTNDGNNNGKSPWANTYVEHGVRVWKTQMMLDEHFNAIGDPDTIYIGTVLPPAFNYITTVHPDGIINYYMQPGDSITPYTYPSTSYSDTFFDIESSRFPNDLLYSGISISFDSLENGVATVSIGIEKERDLSPKEATLTPLTADKSSAFLSANDLICFASITSDYELTLNDTITLSSKGAGAEHTVTASISYNKKTVQLYIETEKLKDLKKYNDWELSISGITTYYGAAVATKNSDLSIDFSSYILPLTADSEQYLTNFTMERDTTRNYKYRYFKLSDAVVLSIYFDDTSNKLYWGEIDTDANKTQITELLLPQSLNIDAWMLDLERKPVEVWKDGDYYFVYIGNYICAYQSKELISYFDISSFENQIIHSIIQDNNGLFVDLNTNFYKTVFENNVISLKKIDIGEYPETNHGIESIYSVSENRHLIFMSTYVRLVDTEKGVVKDFYFTNDECLYVAPINTLYCLDGYFYVFSAYEDVTLYKFDKDLNLISQAVVLKDFSKTVILSYSLMVDFYNNTWVVSIHGTSLGYSNTYLLLCAKNGQVLNYYTYGDAAAFYECYFVPISAHKILMIDENFGYLAPGFKEGSTFSYVRTPCDGHELGAWSERLAPSCTVEGYSQRNCSKCDYFEIQDIAMLGHSFGEWTKELAPTCNASGLEKRSCLRCDEFNTREIPMLEHKDEDGDLLCDLCGYKVGKNSATVGIIIGSAVLGALLIFSFIWFGVKKKSLYDLIGVFKK